MRPKIPAISVLALACLAVGYFTGYHRAHSAYLRQQSIYDLHVYPQLYMRLQEGDTNRIATSLRALMLGPYCYYQTHFSNEIIMNGFTNDLAVARAVFDEERAADDEWNRTNRGLSPFQEPSAADAGSSSGQSTQRIGGGSGFGR
jgi:hypothetical protein